MKSVAALLLMLCSLLLGACAGVLDGSAELPKTGDAFSESMRWKDFQTASLYLQPEAKAEFLEQFVEDDDLHIVSSRIVRAGPIQDGRAEVEYQMEYYRLPSGSLKKWRWVQQWSLEREKLTKSGAWLIENSPPPLPWNK